VRDEFEDSLGLPRGKYEIPLLIFDRIFDLEGQLNYPVSGDAKSPCVPEVFGDAVLVNGKLFPYLEVDARRYRFPCAEWGQWQVLSFEAGDPSNALNFQQIGTDQGLPADTSHANAGFACAW
jgi:spore coat protein A, manganese oxidase